MKIIVAQQTAKKCYKSVVQKFNLNDKLVFERRGFNYTQNPVNAVCELPSIAVFGEYETNCKKISYVNVR